MLYNIFVNQLVLADTKLDLTDAAILYYLKVFCTSTNDLIEKERIRDDTGVWTWVDYNNRWC